MIFYNVLKLNQHKVQKSTVLYILSNYCDQNESFCVHNICVFCVYLLCIYKNTHTVYILKIFTCLYLYSYNLYYK